MQVTLRTHMGEIVALLTAQCASDSWLTRRVRMAPARRSTRLCF